MVVFVSLIFLFSCKKETLGDWSSFYLINMTKDTFIVITYKTINDSTSYIGKFTMYPHGEILFAEPDFSHYRYRDSIFIYKYPDTINVYISFKCNEEPYNYKLNCFNRNDWVDTIYYTRNVNTKGLETYFISKDFLFKIEKDKIINP